MKKQISTVLFIIAGIFAAILRGAELCFVFDQQTGLAEPFAPVSMLLAGLSIAIVVFAVIHAMASRVSSAHNYESAFHMENKQKAILPMAAACALVVVAVLGFRVYFLNTAEVPILIFSLLSVVCAVSVLLVIIKLSRNENVQSVTIFLILPIFWSCFWLIITFQEHAADPVILDYAYEMFAVIAAVLMLYSATGFQFGRSNEVKTRIFSGVCIYFSLLSVLGPIAQSIIYQIGMPDGVANPAALEAVLLNPPYVCLFFSALYGIYVFSTLSRNIVPQKLV